MQIINYNNLFVLVYCVLSVKAGLGKKSGVTVIEADYMVECQKDNVISKKKLGEAAGLGCLRIKGAEWCKDKPGCKKGSKLMDPKRYTSYEPSSSGKEFYRARLAVKPLSGYEYKVIFDFDPISGSCQAVGALYFHLNNEIEFLCTPLQHTPFKLWPSRVVGPESPSPQGPTADKGKEQSDHPSTSGLSRQNSNGKAIVVQNP